MRPNLCEMMREVYPSQRRLPMVSRIHCAAPIWGKLLRLLSSLPAGVPDLTEHVLKVAFESAKAVRRLGGRPLLYWITTHWPPPIEGPDPLGSYVCLQSGKKEAAAELRPGDIVFVYEYRNGPAVRSSGKVIRRKKGLMGIIAMAQARGRVRKNPRPAERLADGTVKNWKWIVPLERGPSTGFIGRAVLNRLLGFGEGYMWRACGLLNSGLKEIKDEVVAAKLVSVFSKKRAVELK